MDTHTLHLSSFQDVTELLQTQFPKALKIFTPLGLGKPNQLINEIYLLAKSKPDFLLDIYSALSLDPPAPKMDVEKDALTAFVDRHFGKDYPRLQYLVDSQKDQLPENINIYEFFFQAGQNINRPTPQHNYVSLNYTHVAPYLLKKKIDVVMQMVSCKNIEGKNHYSLSCNPDLTLDFLDLAHHAGQKPLIVGVIHPDLPFLPGDAIVNEGFFDFLVDSKELQQTLFAVPKPRVDLTDSLIGFYASQLLVDGGSLQIGIGSLSDALASATILRHHKNERYNELVNAFGKTIFETEWNPLHFSTFIRGLFGTSEMIMDSFMYLRQAGILKRLVSTNILGKTEKKFLQGSFFLGSKDFYTWLNTLSAEDFSGIEMRRISFINDLYNKNAEELYPQRKCARFFNTCMSMTLLGAAASDTLDSGVTVSGVGGQYNFVAMAHELPQAASILMLRSTRLFKGQRQSNILWKHGNITIPRHLRDTVITEYGIAELKGKTDEECIKAMLNIADSEFQQQLMMEAKKANKLSPGYAIPSWASKNTPAMLTLRTAAVGLNDFFKAFPFGSDFTEDEKHLILAMEELREFKKLKFKFRISKLVRAYLIRRPRHPLMGKFKSLERGHGLKQQINKTLLNEALHNTHLKINSVF